MSRKGVLAKELLRRESSLAYRPIPTFVQALDKILGGGIKPGVLTELFGDCGIGKTTIGIQLCINVQIPQVLGGPEAEAVFIDTENSFSHDRTFEMAKGFVTHCNTVLTTHEKQTGQKVGRLSLSNVMDGIHVIKCKDLQLFQNIILSLEGLLKANRKIRLIVIDSIAFPFYTTEEGFAGRSQLLYSVAQVLHYLGGAYDVAIIVTNNMTTRFNVSGRPYFIPFLGESWHNVPSQRIKLEWKYGVRSAQILKSPCGPEAEVFYKVAGVGIRD